MWELSLTSANNWCSEAKLHIYGTDKLKGCWPDDRNQLGPGRRSEVPGEKNLVLNLRLRWIARWGKYEKYCETRKNVKNKFLCLLFDSIKGNIWAFEFLVANWFILCPSWPEATSKWFPSQNTRLRPENGSRPQMSPVKRKYKEWVMYQHYFTQRFVIWDVLDY